MKAEIVNLTERRAAKRRPVARRPAGVDPELALLGDLVSELGKMQRIAAELLELIKRRPS
jgi:hypothetical protein